MSSIRKFGENITVARILLGAAGALVGCLGLCAVMTSEALHRVGVGGDDYQRIQAGKDVLGDILPPREYLIEPYLEANLILNGQGALEAHKARLAELRKAFDERSAYWRASPLPEAFKHEIVDVAHAEANAVWQELDTEFLPAASAADRARLAQSFQRLTQHYLAHRAVIDDIASKTASFVDATELGAVEETKEVGWSMAAVFGVLIVVCAGAALALRRGFAARMRVVAERLAVLAAKTSRSAEATKAQTRLDANLAALRSALLDHGAPRLVDDQLYFGDYLINGETAIVDGVRARFGGAVTIFARDARVATNVLDDSGARAIGTRLAGGPAHDALFRKGATFQGETQILGRNYVAIYEPLLVDDQAIGAIFVGVPLEDQAAEPASARNEVARMLEAVATIDAAVEAKSALEREALAERYQTADQSRRVTGRAAAAAADQKLVVASLTKALQRLADNDLTHRIDAELPSEYRSLKRDFERAVGTLSSAIGAVVAQGQTILGVSARITENSDVLARGSAQQATSLEEAVAALKEITASSTRSAEGAEHARSVVADADADAARSAEIVNEAVAAMHVIADSAGKITQIVGLIDEIALQTNLLALNAGVEAARAGDAGRGFAVVATEVRALALRSSEAAKNIRGLIATSTGEVKRGVELVSRTGAALKRIVEQVASLNAIVGGIAHGSKEQASGLGEINSAINLMDHGTHENATIAQQSAEAARTLESEAERLRALVSQFHLPAQGEAPRAWAA